MLAVCGREQRRSDLQSGIEKARKQFGSSTEAPAKAGGLGVGQTCKRGLWPRATRPTAMQNLSLTRFGIEWYIATQKFRVLGMN